MSDAPEPPRALVVREQRFTAVLLLPLLAVALVGYVGYRAWQERGVPLTVRLQQGHGIKTGDTVRFRGIVVGEVRGVELDPGLAEVVLDVRLDPRARALARAGSRFWVVRPQVSLAGIAGIETIVGARYLALLPGDAADVFQRDFAGLEEPPVLECMEQGGLEIALHSTRRGSLVRASPIYYRQIEVGRVLSVGLTSDGNTVEARAYIEPTYAPLVCELTRFWRASGIDVQADLRGFRLRTESLQTLLAGGIALATPSTPGAAVGTGHRFALADEPDKEWLEWQPSIPLGSALLPAGTPLVRPLRAALTWEKSRIIYSDTEERHGWVLALDDGLLGPAELLRPGDNARDGSVRLDVAGERLELAGELVWEDSGLGLLPLTLAVPRPSWPTWPKERIRRAERPEDCLVIADPAAKPLALAEAKLELADGVWRVEGGISLDGDWHGACVLGRSDGALIGMLLVRKGRARIVPLRL